MELAQIFLGAALLIMALLGAVTATWQAVENKSIFLGVLAVAGWLMVAAVVSLGLS